MRWLNWQHGRFTHSTKHGFEPPLGPIAFFSRQAIVVIKSLCTGSELTNYQQLTVSDYADRTKCHSSLVCAGMPTVNTRLLSSHPSPTIQSFRKLSIWGSLFNCISGKMKQSVNASYWHVIICRGTRQFCVGNWLSHISLFKLFIQRKYVTTCSNKSSSKSYYTKT